MLLVVLSLIISVLVFLALNVILQRQMSNVLNATSERISLVDTVVKNIRHIKMKALEMIYHLKIFEKRENEIYFLKLYKFTTIIEHTLQWAISVLPLLVLVFIQ